MRFPRYNLVSKRFYSEWNLIFQSSHLFIEKLQGIFCCTEISLNHRLISSRLPSSIFTHSSLVLLQSVNDRNTAFSLSDRRSPFWPTAKCRNEVFHYFNWKECFISNPLSSWLVKIFPWSLFYDLFFYYKLFY